MRISLGSFAKGTFESLPELPQAQRSPALDIGPSNIKPWLCETKNSACLILRQKPRNRAKDEHLEEEGLDGMT
jgi:hypothetical protein